MTVTTVERCTRQTSSSMRRSLARIALRGLVVAGIAGGFWLQVGNPDASPEARKLNAVLTLKAAGCSDPAHAKLSGTAVGIVNGQRKTIPLQINALSEPGMFAIAQQWPKEGKWVLQIEGASDGRVTSTLVNAGPEGVDRLHAKMEMKPVAERDIDAMLR